MSLELKDVTAGYYRDLDILHGISLVAKKSEITCVIGPNGSGKSTILKTVCGFLRSKEGNISLGGEDITRIEPHMLPGKGISFVPQDRSVFPSLTVEENLEMGMWIYRKDRKRMREAINEVYDRFPILRERKNQIAQNFSGGEQKMIELGRALVTHPKFVILDEPTAGLAPKVAERIYEELGKFKDEGTTTFFVDQNVKRAVMLSDYIYVLKQGQIAGHCPKEELDKGLGELIKEWLL